ncbi:MAG: CBS domain-containing protein [Nitrospirota bacterium]
MTLKDAVDSKPSKVIACKTTDTIAVVAAMMNGNNAGSVLVYDAKKRLAGIISDTDISDCTAKSASLKNERAEGIMTRNPLTLSALTDASMALNVMTEMKLSHLPVTEDEKVIGMISYKDLESCLMPEMICQAKDN